MPLTTEQIATLRSSILAATDQATVDALAARNTAALADIYNLDASPAFVVWRTTLEPAEYREGVVWTEVDALTAGKARIWEWLTQSATAPLEPHKNNVRQGLADAWASSTTTRANLLAMAKRGASRVERLFVTGTGTTAAPGLLVYEGPISSIEIAEALRGI